MANQNNRSNLVVDWISRSGLCTSCGALANRKLDSSGLRTHRRRPHCYLSESYAVVSAVFHRRFCDDRPGDYLELRGHRCRRRDSTRDLLRLADAKGYSSLRVLALPSDDRSAQFYASGRVIYGSDGEAKSVYDAPQVVTEARQRNEKLLAFIKVRDLNLYREKPGVEIIGDNGKLALVCLF